MILIVAPIVAIFTVGIDKEKVFYPRIYRCIAVNIALIIFVCALFRIRKIVKGLEGAYPNQFYMNAHFVLLLLTLFFNIIGLFYYLVDVDNKKLEEITEEKLKFYFAF